MVQTSASSVETVHIVQELQELFSNKNSTLETLISNLQSVRYLLSQLPNMIMVYERQGKKIDQESAFLEILKKFKNLIENTINKSIHDPGTILVINYHISTIRQGYELFLNYGQTLKEINELIEEQIRLKNKKEIGTLIIRGIETKIPKFINFDHNKPDDDEAKLGIIRKFYDYFIKYILYVRESLDNMLNDNNYRAKLENLQSKLLNSKPSDIETYFSLIKLKMITDRGYSTEILLEYLVKNEMVYIRVSNESELYCKHLIEMFKKSPNKKCTKSLSNLVFKLQDNSFKDLCRQFVENNDVVKSIYDKGIQLYLIESQKLTEAKKNKEGNVLYENILENCKQLITKFKVLFLLFSLKKSTLIMIRESIIDENNAIGTHKILTDLYGQRIANLDFSDEYISVKYCFNYYFFKSLLYQDLDDVNRFSEFNQLLFYIHICADNDTLDYQPEDIHLNKLSKLKKDFLCIDNANVCTKLNDLIEIVKFLINIGSFEIRLENVRSVICSLEKDQIHIKATFINKFLDHQKFGSQICLRLAQSFNIDLIKHIPDAKTKILPRLGEFNSNFGSVLNRLKKSGMEFNINQELTPGFSIPYYLSAKLADDPKYNNRSENYNENTNEIIMSILFKVFNCSTENDKKVFLKNKNLINQEFNKLYKSVKQLIEFYDVSDNVEISKQLREKLRNRSIDLILDGFSQANEESLSNRNEYARIIIDNFINYKLEQVPRIIESTKSTTEVLELFDTFMKRNVCDNLDCWTKNTSEFSDKIYFLYCYHHYKQEEFDKWYEKLNSDIGSTIIKKNRKDIENNFKTNKKAFELINIKYLQHNQVGALALIHDYLTDELKKDSNLFIKIGTGQGKSLTIAETARQIVQKNRNAPNPKVFVITCYDHLAKRDHGNYQKYYQYFNIATMYCSSTSSTEEFFNKDVIYTDLNTYFDVLRRKGYSTLVNGTSITLPNITDTVLVMDEFDSLILDSDEIFQYLHEFDVNITNRNTSFDKKEDLTQLFGAAFIAKCNSEFSKIYDEWWNTQLSKAKAEGSNEQQTSFQDSLGKDVKLGISRLNHLNQYKKAEFVHYYLDALVFYSQFKRVIGFSGSIEKEHLSKFQRLFDNKISHYYDIPPFFGPTNAQQNRTFVNDPGKVIRNTDDFLNAIKEEIQLRYQEQPILIFADSYKQNEDDKSDYDCIRTELLGAQNTFLKGREIIEIKKEDDIAENIRKIGKLDLITLATRIIGRGADIKVDKSITKGLHLILTYYPLRENIYTQMLGRTARQDEKGSYSIIVRKGKQFPLVPDVTVNLRNKKIHELTEYFYRHYHFSSNKVDIRLKWLLFSELMQTLSELEMQKYSLEDLQKFVKNNILK
ncbi:unnamed protein product [Adineta steineri]|uniref:SecA DEAD-like N-terminal domain-containing protein n=1 Tax=Adineta steineri TaxID=433720 RepID=A0A814P5J0_9BILA|nr:unnamed protein product [Adineta steineri]CAF1153075.1 unnamed protein product [Adineta steineri]